MNGHSQTDDLPPAIGATRWLAGTTLSYLLVGLGGGALFLLCSTIYFIGRPFYKLDDFYHMVFLIFSLVTSLVIFHFTLLVFRRLSLHWTVLRKHRKASRALELQANMMGVAMKVGMIEPTIDRSTVDSADADTLEVIIQIEANIDQLERSSQQLKWQRGLTLYPVRKRLDLSVRRLYLLAKILEVAAARRYDRNRFW